MNNIKGIVNSIFKAMKKLISVLFGCAMLLQCQAADIRLKDRNPQEEPSQRGSLTISVTPDLFNLASGWVSGYSSINPGIKVRIENQADIKNGGTANYGADLPSFPVIFSGCQVRSHNGIW